MFSRELGCFDFAFGAALAKATGHEDRVIAFQMRGGIALVKDLGVDPVHIDLAAVVHAAVDQGLFDGLIGVFKLGVFAHNGHGNFAVCVVDPVVDVVPAVEIWFRGRGDLEGVQHRLVKAFAVVGQRGFVDGL